ncbi:MAG: deoxyribose-phosphate aldolase [Candidatus Cloacimonetes bacterium]|nr:deoxyribose-phosphate aldolase [Candidatus Cloacimonadota bacterium]
MGNYEILNIEKLAKMIDHTELKSSSGQKKILNLCNEAKMFGFISVCINPYYVKFAYEQLQGSDVLVCSVVGFPLGMNTSKQKAIEAENAVKEGAKEIDMVINVGAMRDKRYNLVLDDIKQVVKASAPAHVKVIFETCYLKDDEIIKACELSVEAGAHFVKTSTGFGAFGAFPYHVKLMRETVGPEIGVKAAGGISNFKDAWRMITAGANRLGTSAGVMILEGAKLFKFAPEAWLEPEIPCHICPSRFSTLAKLPKAVYTYYKKKCLTCEHRDTYNKFYE